MKPPSDPKRRLIQAGRQLLAGLVDLVYPPQCLLCGQALREDAGVGLCTDCTTDLTNDMAATCPRCASTIGPHAPTVNECPRCAKDSYHFERAYRFGRYEGKRREAILLMKHHSGEALAEAMGQLWAQARRPELSGLSIDAVAPIPLHWLRWWQRGYNQAEALARPLAQALHRPCRTHWLWRRRNTPPQKLQSATERRRQMRGTFHARLPKELKGATILLIDDVLTTGSTCSDAARALREAGAAHVFVAVLGRAES